MERKRIIYMLMLCLAIFAFNVTLPWFLSAKFGETHFETIKVETLLSDTEAAETIKDHNPQRDYYTVNVTTYKVSRTLVPLVYNKEVYKEYEGQPFSKSKNQ